MLTHHIQQKILYKLAFSDGLRFSELKPEGIENKLFDYHLKNIIRDGLVEKKDDVYQLTHEGRMLGIRAYENELSITDLAYSILLLIIRRKSDGAWLLYKRGTHPLKNKVGFMHATPQAGKNAFEQAKQEAKSKAGLDCNFEPRGSGFITTYDGDNLESFINYTVLVCEDAKGELEQLDQTGEYSWVQNPDFESGEMIPNVKFLAEEYSKGQPFFLEKTIKL